MNEYKVILSLLLSVLSTYSQNLESKEKKFEIAEEWKHAAEDWETGAYARWRKADEELEKADSYRKKEYLYDFQRKQNMLKAGQSERLAGEMFFKSIESLENAVRCWEKVVNEYKRLEEEEKYRTAFLRFHEAKQKVLFACQQAAYAYELAGEAFSKENGDDAFLESECFEKAAKCREEIAKRKEKK